MTVRSRLHRDISGSSHRTAVVRRQTLRMGHTHDCTESFAPRHKCVIPQEVSCPTTNATNGTYATLNRVACAATQVRHTTGSQLSDDKRYEWDIRHTVRSRLRRDTSASYHRKSVVRRQTLRMGHTPHSTESLAPRHKCVIPQEVSCPTTNATNGTYA